MDRIESINRDRISWCARERGLSIDEVAREAGVPAKALALLMDDGTGLTFAQLRKLADYFGRGVLFFLDQGPVDEDRVHTVQYRTLTGQKPELSNAVRKLIERVERQRELYLSLREDLHTEDYPVFEPINVRADQPAAAAAAVRAWLRLAHANTFDAYRAAVEAKGILVFRSNGYAGRWQIAKESSILGFSLYSDTCPVIVVKKVRTETQQTFTLMHELGHLMLHRASSIDDDADMHSHVGQERDANAFAGHLLVPDAQLATIRDDERPAAVEHFDAWLAQYRQRWGVSGEVILRRLLDAGRLTQERYTAYRTYVRGLPFDDEDEATGSRLYRHREPKHIFGDTFVRTVLGAFNARRITATKACSYLDGLKLSDLRTLEQHIAGV